MRIRFWSNMLSILSLTFSNPLIGLVHDLVRLFCQEICGIRNEPSFPLLFEIIISSLGELDFWFVHRSFSSYKRRNLRRREPLHRAFSTILSRKGLYCLANNLQEFLLRCLEIEHPCKKIPLYSSTLTLIIAHMFQGQVTIQNATWFQFFWCVLTPYLVNDLGPSHRLRHRLGLS